MPRDFLAALHRGLILAIAAGVLVPDRPASAQDQEQVLVLYSNRRDAQIVTVGDRELPRILNTGHPNGVDYYSEFIDRIRLSNTDYVAAFREFVNLKYGAHRFDLVMKLADRPQEGSALGVKLLAGNRHSRRLRLLRRHKRHRADGDDHEEH